MADKQGHLHGPVESPMEWVPGSGHSPDGGVTGGMPGYPKSDDGKIKEVIFDQSGEFGKVKPAKE